MPAFVTVLVPGPLIAAVPVTLTADASFAVPNISVETALIESIEVRPVTENALETADPDSLNVKVWELKVTVKVSA